MRKWSHAVPLTFLLNFVCFKFSVNLKYKTSVKNGKVSLIKTWL